MTRIAITREISSELARCELTHLERQPIDLDRARAQHRAYEQLLEQLGCRLQRLPAREDTPDSVFIEDTAIVLDELAILTRPGAESRRGELPAVAEALAPHRSLGRIEAPATLDGGDVFLLGHRLFVGLSSRSNPESITQLQTLVHDFGYEVHAVPVHGCLHLKTAACPIGDETLLIHPQWVAAEDFPGLQCVAIDPAEPFAANVVRVGDHLIHAAEFERTRRHLEALGYSVAAIEASELAKAEGGVSCCSLLLTPQV